MLGKLKKRNYQILSTNLRRHHGSLRHSPNSFIDRMFSMFDFDSKYVLTFVSQQTSVCHLVWELITKNCGLVAPSYLKQTVQAIVNCETIYLLNISTQYIGHKHYTYHKNSDALKDNLFLFHQL